MNRFSQRPGRLVAGVISLLLLASPAAAAAEGPAPTETLERALAEAEEALRLGESELAESRYRRALAEGWLILGSLRVGSGELRAALDAFERAASVSLETRRAALAVSLLRLELGEARDAIPALRDLLARRPDDGEARRLFARALLAEGRAAEALEELEVLRAQDPGDLETAFTLATGYLRLGEPEAAAELLELIAREVATPQAWILAGRTYRDFGEHERAREALLTALELDPETPRAHYYLGTVELLEEGRLGLEAAEQSFRRELELRPDDPVAQLYLGLVLVETRRYREALPALETAAAAPGSRADALHFLGQAHLGLGELEAAEKALRGALALAGEEAAQRPEELSSIHYKLGQTLRRAGDEEGARHHFEQAERYTVELTDQSRDRLARYLATDDEAGGGAGLFVSALSTLTLPGVSGERAAQLAGATASALARAYLNLGILELQSGRPAAATDLLAAGAELAPGFPQLQRSLGVAAFNAERYRQAVEPLERALAEQPDDRALRNMLAMAWLNVEEYARAAELLAGDARRSLSPQLEYAYGLALVRSGRADEAQPVFDRLLRQHADWPELNVLLGQAHAERSEYPAAERFLRRALELDPEVPEAHAALGLLHLRRGELDAAQAELERELELHPGDLRNRFHLATVLDLNRQSDAARAELSRILEAEPAHGDARYLLGKILLTAGETEAAAEQLEIAAQLQPEEPNVHYQLGQAYQKLGRREAAAERFERFRELKERSREPTP